MIAGGLVFGTSLVPSFGLVHSWYAGGVSSGGGLLLVDNSLWRHSAAAKDLLGDSPADASSCSYVSTASHLARPRSPVYLAWTIMSPPAWHP